VKTLQTAIREDIHIRSTKGAKAYNFQFPTRDHRAEVQASRPLASELLEELALNVPRQRNTMPDKELEQERSVPRVTA
jgi:hypothetical protein